MRRGILKRGCVDGLICLLELTTFVQWETEEKMPRLIDADAVLDAIRDYFVELAEEREKEYGADEIPMGVINPYLEMNKTLRTKVKQIPTVDAVPTEFHDKCMQIEIEKRFELELNSEEVVRCRDCIYYHKGNWYDDDVQADYCIFSV